MMYRIAAVQINPKAMKFCGGKYSWKIKKPVKNDRVGDRN